MTFFFFLKLQPWSVLLNQIDAAELEALLARSQATFPDNTSVWLKDLAAMLNMKLDNGPEADPVFQGKSQGRETLISHVDSRLCITYIHDS